MDPSFLNPLYILGLVQDNRYIWSLIFGITTAFLAWYLPRRKKISRMESRSAFLIVFTDVSYDYFLSRKLISLIYGIMLSFFYANVYFIFLSGSSLYTMKMFEISLATTSFISMIVVRLICETFVAVMKTAENSTFIRKYLTEKSEKLM